MELINKVRLTFNRPKPRLALYFVSFDLTGGDREYTVLRTFFIRLIEALKREILK